jgi:hypothetical protein
MATALVVHGRSLALLVALGIWMVVTFMVPQFTSGLRPTASLNPIVQPVSTSQQFFRMTSNLRPFSISEQYRDASASILQTAPDGVAPGGIQTVLPIGALLAVLGLLTAALINRLDLSERNAHD